MLRPTTLVRTAVVKAQLRGALPLILGWWLLLALALVASQLLPAGQNPASVLVRAAVATMNAAGGLLLPVVMAQECRRPLDQWTRHLIDEDRPGRAAFLYLADIDEDGRKDVVTGRVWYANPGDASKPWVRTAVGTGFDDVIAVYDFDGDGDLDLLGTATPGNQLPFVWARFEGNCKFTVLTNIDSDLDVPENIPIQGVAVAHFQPNGPLEVALAWDDNIGGTQMLTVPDDPAVSTWPRRQASAFSEGEALSSADIDHDGDIDLFTGSTWLRNDGPNDQWTPLAVYPITSGAPDRTRLVDMDGDGDLDAVVGYGHDPASKVAWYEQASGPFEAWPEHLIANLTVPRSSFPQSLDVGDIDGDGDLDVVAGQHRWYGDLSNLRAYVLENLSGDGREWATHLVYSGDEHHDGAPLLDIENDGDLDIVSIGWTHGRVLLYENSGQSPCPSPSPSPAPATPAPTASGTAAAPPSSTIETATPTAPLTETAAPGPTVTATATPSAQPSLTATVPALATATPTLTPSVAPTATLPAAQGDHRLLLPLVQS